MPSFLFSPSPTAVLLLLLSLSLPLPLSSHRNLLHSRNLHSSNTEQDPNDSPIPKSKPTSELPETKNKTKSLKSNTQNPSFSSSSKLNKTANQLNKTINTTKKNSTKSNSTKTGQINYLKALPSKSPSIPKPKPQNPPADRLADTDITTAGSDDDLISDFRDLPSRLHSAILPDLEKLSLTSKHYLSKTHRDITAGVKPFVGNQYAPSIAYAASSAVFLLPLFLLAAVFRHLLRSASLHRSLLFVQAYLAVYFTTLSLTAVVTGLEPLWFFYAASPSAYAWMQAVQTFGYLVYLVAQVIVVLVGFSAGEGERRPGKVVGFAQVLLGLAVGMHYYITVFHRAVAGEAPRANWKVHGIYAACFVVICGLGRAGRGKKVYFYGEGGVDSKLS